MSDAKVIPIGGIRESIPVDANDFESLSAAEVAQEVRLVLHTSKGDVDISDADSMTDIRSFLKKNNVPKSERISIMDYLNKKKASGELVFYDKLKIETI